jgi:hypothetical protein
MKPLIRALDVGLDSHCPVELVELPVELDLEELYAIGQSNCQSNLIIQKWCRWWNW